MLHHHINQLDIERLDDYSSIELEARLQDIVHRITHLEHMKQEAEVLAIAISDRISDHTLAKKRRPWQRPIRSIGAEALSLEHFYNGL